MSNTINESHYSGYNTPRNQGASGSDKVARHIQKLFSKNSFSGNVELGQDSDGRISVLNDHPQKSEIENLLNNDAKLSSMLAGQKAPATDDHDITQDEQGKQYTNSHGDSAFISDDALDALTRHDSNDLGTTDNTAMSFNEYIDYLRTLSNPEHDEANRQGLLNINYNDYSLVGKNRDSGFNSNRTGGMWFEKGLGRAIALRDMEWEIAPGKSAVIQERDILNHASASRKKAYGQLQTAMKRAGITLKEGEKVDFVMDEKGNIKVNPDSKNDKGLAAKIEGLFKDDKNLGASVRDFLHMSEADIFNNPAAMRLHVDSVLREYTGKGFDDLEWDSSGNLVIPEGFENAVEQFNDLGSTIGHLKSIQESKGDDIFRKEFSFTVTTSGIIGDQMKSRAGSNLFKEYKMFENRGVYTDEPMLDVNGNKTGMLKPDAGLENFQSEYWEMQSLKSMIQAEDMTVYIAADPANNFVEDENGNRQSLPYKSANYDATANYLIENYFIENGIEGNVSDYALKINSKGSYEVVRIPPPDVSRLQQPHGDK